MDTTPRPKVLISEIDVEGLRRVVGEVLDDRHAALEQRLVHKLGSDRANGPAAFAQMVTERELAELLCCDPRTVRRLERAGQIPPALRIGSGSKRWPVNQLRAWLDELGRKTGHPAYNEDAP